MPASGPPLASSSSTRVSAVPAMVSSAVSRAEARATASTVRPVRPGRRRTLRAARTAASRQVTRPRAPGGDGSRSVADRAGPSRPFSSRSRRSARRGEVEVVGDEHDGAAVLVGQRRSTSATVRLLSRRGCRWARRPAPGGARWPAPGRWPPAGARRRSARPGGVAARSPTPSRSSSSAARRRRAAPGRPAQGAGQLDVLGRRQAVEQPEVLEHEPDRVGCGTRPGRRSTAIARSWPSTRTVPLCGRSSPPSSGQQRRLAAPRGADQRHELAVLRRRGRGPSSTVMVPDRPS